MSPATRTIGLFVVSLLVARAASAQFQTWAGDLTGGAVVPASGSTGSGYARLDILNAADPILLVDWTDLSGACTAINVRGPAAAGANGPVVQTSTCTAAASGRRVMSFSLSAPQMIDLRNGLDYVEVVTAAHPGGEVRAQLRTALPYVARFGAAGVVPTPSTAPGTGTAAATIASSGYVYFTLYLSPGTYTALDLHGPALPGATGPVLLPLGAGGPTSTVYSGVTVTATPALLGQLRAGQLYFDVHTAAFPDGALRAQVHAPNLALDFNGEGREEMSLFRNGTGVWYGQDVGSTAFTGIPWGTIGDRPAPGDFDGDGAGDQSVFRNGTFYVRGSFNGDLRATPFGLTGDEPRVSADYDADGRADIAVARSSPTSTYFYWLQSSDGAFHAVNWGAGDSDVALTGDFDGDHKNDPVVYRVPTNSFYVLGSTAGFMAFPFGVFVTDFITPADYDGDGKTDFAVYRFDGATPGVWYIWQSATNTLRAEAFGSSTDLPVPADYDGDGKADIAVARSVSGNRVWFVRRSSDGGFAAGTFGLSGDVPLPFLLRVR